MTRKDKVLTLLGIVILFLMLCWYADAPAQATDTYVGACAAQPACVLAQNVSWVNGNQVWRFTAWQQNESIRIWILNHNPTSAHTSQTVQVFITDEGNVPTLTANADRWVQAAVSDNAITAAQCKNVAASAPAGAPGANGKGTCYTVGMYAVQIAVRITGANAQAGNPDTFDIGIVQQATTYPGGPQPGQDSSSGGAGGVGSTPADGTSNTAIPGFQNYMMYFNPAGTWDRVAGGNSIGLAVGQISTGADSLSNALALRPAGVSAGTPTAATGTNVFPYFFNGSTWDRQFYCNKTVFITALGAATTQIVALSGTTKIRVCSITYSNTNATPTNVKLVEGTGANCVSGQTQLTGNIGLAATPSTFVLPQVNWITNVAGDALCATGSAAGAVDITLTFAQY